MPEEAVDFWPDLSSVLPRTPLLILKQQAALLGKHTKNLVIASVLTHTYNERFFHSFIIEATALNYRYELLTFSHDLMLYPVTVESGPEQLSRTKRIFKSEDEFVAGLKDLLNSDQTKRLLGTLLAQVEA
jgi:hypothetical protein